MFVNFSLYFFIYFFAPKEKKIKQKQRINGRICRMLGMSTNGIFFGWQSGGWQQWRMIQILPK